MSTNVSEKVRRNAINYAIYNWTEANGKYNGNEYWSVEAYGKWAYEEKRAYKLIHEHIIPRKVIREKIDELEKLDSLSLYLLFKKYVIAVVITKEEDNLFRKGYGGQNLISKMPKEFGNEQEEWFDNPWSRYLAVNKQDEEFGIELPEGLDVEGF